MCEEHIDSTPQQYIYPTPCVHHGGWKYKILTISTPYTKHTALQKFNYFNDLGRNEKPGQWLAGCVILDYNVSEWCIFVRMLGGYTPHEKVFLQIFVSNL